MAPRKPAANPFNNDDEAQTSTNNNAAKDVFVTDTKNEVVATFNGGTGFESPWVVVHTPDLESMDELLSDRDTLQAVLAKTWEHGAYFQEQAPTRSAASSKPASGSGNSRPPAPKGPAAGTPVPDCKHSDEYGSMVYREGITKSGPRAGETYKGFFCPSPQGTPDQCRPQFLK